MLGTDDRWDVSFALRALPFVRAAPVGPWPHTKPPPFLHWREPLPEPGEAATRVVRGYLAGYGPATREDIQQFTGLRLGQIDAALDGHSRARRALRPAARAARRRGRSRSRSLPACVRLDHPRAPRPEQDRPARVRRRRLQQEERDDEEHVHGRRLRCGRVADREEAHRGRAVRAAARARSARGRCGGRAAARLVPGVSPAPRTWLILDEPGSRVRARRASARARARRAAPRGRPRHSRCRGSPRAQSPAA